MRLSIVHCLSTYYDVSPKLSLLSELSLLFSPKNMSCVYFKQKIVKNV